MPEFHFQTEVLAPKAIRPINTAHGRRSSVREGTVRILMVGMHLTKTRGGITTLTSSILGSRLSRKYSISYIASQAEDLGKARKLLLAIWAALNFTFSCLLSRPEVVYVHIGSNASLYRESAFILVAKLLGRKVITHFHAGDVGTYLPVQPHVCQNFISWALAHSDQIIAVSQESANDLAKIVPSGRVTILANAIDLSWLKTDPEGKVDDKIRLLFVGAVGKLKGEEDLVAALALLRDRNVNFKASFVGYGAERLTTICEHLGVLDMIEHLGPVSLNDRAKVFSRADIFVLPTYAEAMPVSVIEAMAAGLPVITTPIGGIPEIIEHEKEGLLFACGDIRAMADHIMRLAVDEELRARIGQKARKRVAEQMDFGRYIDRLEVEIEAVRLG